MNDDHKKINQEIRWSAIIRLINEATESGLPFTIEEDRLIVALPPDPDTLEDPLLD